MANQQFPLTSRDALLMIKRIAARERELLKLVLTVIKKQLQCDSNNNTKDR
jgi:hypothetical protein